MRKSFPLTIALLLGLALLLTACDPMPAPLQSPSPTQSAAPEGDNSGTGFLNDTMSSVFFDFTVTDAFSCESYEGYTAPENWKLVVATITVKNTYTMTIPMGAYDFQIQWGEGDEDYDYPLSAYCEAQLPDEYELLISESRTGILVYEVPADTKDYSISYLEVYDDDETGDCYFVYFSAPFDKTAGGTL
ncbi:hypothetical protein SDC9_143622 [bioreactor metagenome]|uniref:DUF4352 domain-containing protein n=1 Tax=bioreactor metagenome TaxID=1076179 RepID=A0A645E4I9_9ZZZZ